MFVCGRMSVLWGQVLFIYCPCKNIRDLQVSLNSLCVSLTGFGLHLDWNKATDDLRIHSQFAESRTLRSGIEVNTANWPHPISQSLDDNILNQMLSEGNGSDLTPVRLIKLASGVAYSAETLHSPLKVSDRGMDSWALCILAVPCWECQEWKALTALHPGHFSGFDGRKQLWEWSHVKSPSRTKNRLHSACYRNSESSTQCSSFASV